MESESSKKPAVSTEMKYKNAMPVLPLRDVVIFPRMAISLYVGRTLSLRALEVASKEGGEVFLVTQKSAETEEPKSEDLHAVGCVANILQMLPMPNDSIKVLVEGVARSHAEFRREEDGPIFAQVSPFPMSDRPVDEESTAMCRALQGVIAQYARVNKKVGEEIRAKIQDMNDLGRLSDLVAGNFPMDIDKRQDLLETPSHQERIDKLMALISRETEVQKIDRKIRGRVKEQVEKSHREYYLQEQARAIQKELGDDHGNELETLKKRVQSAGMTEQARKKCEQELKKLQLMSPMSAEASVTRSYVETILSLPWKKRSKSEKNPKESQEALDLNHYGLEKVKERIMEYLAVQRRVPEGGKAPILCLVGPPGVGKTSLGRSIAAATGRQFGRISLGGVRDEAEIRGHRRTYIGAMPGKIINAMIRATVKNPIILLDEVDKMGYDFRGDPAAALLEVLDPEQNKAFSDHYIDVDYDLSEVMFIATANTMNIPPALQDRLEIIHLSGYTEEEKIHIAVNHLLPRQFKENGLQENEATIRPTAVRDIIRHYTREAGVRSLERDVGKICRKLVLHIDRQSGKKKKETKPPMVITPNALKKYLGTPKFRYGVAAGESRIGQVNGMAWTEVGGELLSVEACAFPGKGNIIRTGKLGEVMKESVAAAFSVVLSRATDYGLTADDIKKKDYHIHFPEGATPKDGPSAGIAVATAILSVVTRVPVRRDVAMTGEITLRGEVLPIGGVKEKLLAAARGGITHIILPKENEKDLAEVPANIRNKFTISAVKWVDEVFNLALVEEVSRAEKSKAKAAAPRKRRSGQSSADAPLLPH
jgi:ATP-dependent Lon protease